MKRMTKLWPMSKVLPQDYEKWVEDYEAKGWHLEKVSMFGIIHKFVKGEPKKFRYCYDCQNKRQPEYEKIFSDLGWELVFYSCGSYIWRKEYTDERPEAFTDNDSLISRNSKLIGVYICTLAAAPAVMNNSWNHFSLQTPISACFFIFFFMVYAYLIYVTIRLHLANKKLKANK